jgi:lysylphosphatidylglycerol synthetase-like protein (DUF2156 family)
MVSHGRTAFGRWMLFWLGGPVLGVGNGALREAVYARRLGELRAHQLSTLTLVALLGGYVAALERRWPIARASDAALVGAAWAAMTAEFELAFGHYVAHAPWSQLLRDYDLRKGRLWSLVLCTATLAPAAARAVRVRRTSHGGRPDRAGRQRPGAR